MTRKIKLFWSKNFVNKAIIVCATLFFVGLIGNLFTESEIDTKQEEEPYEIKNKSFKENKEIEKCDGIDIISDCELDGITYKTYKYHPAQDETYHYETNTTYEKKIVGYCTLCNDGTRSPSCSTGRGTCSHHGGVAEWNAPVYSNIEKKEQVKIVDSPSVSEWYEKVVKG